MLTQTANPLLLIPLRESKKGVRISARDPIDITVLTRRVAAGDEQAFADFHERYFERLYRFLLVLTRGQEDEAEEALQQTFLRVIRYARTFDCEETFWCWLKAVARSAVRDAGRKQQRYSAVLRRFGLFWGGTHYGDPSPDLDDGFRNKLEAGLNQLSAFDRQLIEGKYLDGTTTRDLALQTGLTEKAIESRLGRLRRQLRDELLKNLEAE